MPKSLSYRQGAFLLLLCMQEWIPISAVRISDVSTAEELVRAVRQFAASGEDTDVYLVRNITFAGANTSDWPIRNLRSGTVRIRPHANLGASGLPVFVDWAMERGLTEQFSGARIEWQNVFFMNLCFGDLVFNPAKNYHHVGGFGFLAFERSRQVHCMIGTNFPAKLSDNPK